MVLRFSITVPHIIIHNTVDDDNDDDDDETHQYHYP